MKSILFALALSAPLALSLAPAPAQADTDIKFKIYFGEPYYTYRPGRDYIYRKGYGWHRNRVVARNKLSCSQARNIVRNHGYRVVATRDCSGTTYTFRTTSNGRAHIVYVNARTGGLWRG